MEEERLVYAVPLLCGRLLVGARENDRIQLWWKQQQRRLDKIDNIIIHGTIFVIFEQWHGRSSDTSPISNCGALST
jgi:hypothetical protein